MDNEWRDILNDWKNTFPMLRPVSGKLLLKIVGPLLVGFELKKLSPLYTHYRPYFVVFPLWRANVKECLKAPILYPEFHKKNGLQFDVYLEEHSKFFPEILDAINTQLLFPLDGIVTFEEAIKGVQPFPSKWTLPKLLIEQLRRQLLHIEFYMALYTGDSKTIKNTLDKYDYESAEWEIPKMEVWYGSYGQPTSLREQVGQREQFMQQVMSNRNDAKLKKLQISEITA